METLHALERDCDLADGIILSRHLDLPKYLDLLRTGELYLRRADKFPDRFEGALSPALRDSIDNGHKSGILEYDADEFYRRCRKSSFVSCWSLGTPDNMALWLLYGGASTSVAITTTVQQLTIACLQWDEKVIIHKVRYIDHFKNPDMVTHQGKPTHEKYTESTKIFRTK